MVRPFQVVGRKAARKSACRISQSRLCAVDIICWRASAENTKLSRSVATAYSNSAASRTCWSVMFRSDMVGLSDEIVVGVVLLGDDGHLDGVGFGAQADDLIGDVGQRSAFGARV